jgi:hypothetical protein
MYDGTSADTEDGERQENARGSTKIAGLHGALPPRAKFRQLIEWLAAREGVK